LPFARVLILVRCDDTFSPNLAMDYEHNSIIFISVAGVTIITVIRILLLSE